MVSVFVCQAGRPGSSPVQSVYFRNVEFYQYVIDLSPSVPTTGSPKAAHVLSFSCDNVCKRPLAICRKSRASCPVNRLLSVPIWPAYAKNRDVNMNKQTKPVLFHIWLQTEGSNVIQCKWRHLSSFNSLAQLSRV